MKAMIIAAGPSKKPRLLEGGKKKMVDMITLKTTDLLAEEFYKRYNDKKNMEEHRSRFVNLIKGKKILDVGCGTGRDCREFSKLGFEVDGIDVSEEMLKFAKKEVPNAHLYQMSMENLTSDRKYNGIWVCSSLYHIKKKDVFDILKSFYKILEEEGLLFITVKEGVGQGYSKRDYFGNLKKFYAFYKYYELIRLLEGANFDVFLMEKEYKDQTWINLYARKKNQQHARR